MDATLVISLLGALGLGSVVGQYVASMAERRGVRAAALGALASTENARWSGEGRANVSFPEAARSLESAALVARLPRRAVTQYLTLAYAASWLSHESWEHDPDPEYGGGINTELANVVRRSATLLTDLAWAPRLQRLRLRRRMAEIETIADDISSKDVIRALRSARLRQGSQT